jgi:hypothetical protein
MGRYYWGDIEGKFWFAVQCSTAPERFGCQENTSTIEYYVDEDSIDEIKDELKSIEDKLGDNIQKFDSFFEKNNKYNDAMLEENGLDRKLLGDYADYGLGKKILECVEENGSCSFTAEC